MLNLILRLGKHGNKWKMADLGAIILHCLLITRNKKNFLMFEVLNLKIFPMLM